MSDRIETRWQAALLKLFSPPGRLLAVGRAGDRFLELAQAAGFAGVGAAAFFAQPEPTGRFAVVTAWDLAAHAPDLHASLARLPDLLEPGGCFFFSTAGVGAQSLVLRAVSEVFGAEPLLLPFDDRSPPAGVMRQGGLTDADRALCEVLHLSEESRAQAEERLTNLKQKLALALEQLSEERLYCQSLEADIAHLGGRLDQLLGSASFRVGRGIVGVLERAPFSQAVWDGFDAVKREGAAKVLKRTAQDLQRRLELRGNGAGGAHRFSGLAPRGQAAGEVAGLVSVVLPVYNQAELLATSIASVLAQTYSNFELIIVNDGSKDDVRRVLDAHRSDPRIRVLTQPNQGLPKALSNGFDLARGELWTWTSADNIMEPGQLAAMVAFLGEHEDVAMVYADYLAIDDAGKPLRDPSFRPQNRRAPHSAEIRLPRSTERLSADSDNFIGGCFLYRGAMGRLIGEYDPDMGVEDYDYWMRINDLGKIAHLGSDALLYRYRVHDNTLNARARELKIFERLERLMAYERERQSFYHRPFTIAADPALLEQLATIALPHPVVELRDGALPAGKRILLLSPERAREIAPAALGTETCVAIWFGADANAPFEARLDIHRLKALCVTTDAATASRLRLFAPEVFVSGSSAAAVEMILIHANNRLFYEVTRPPRLRQRRPPDVYLPEGRPVRVVLQVDDFVQGGLEQVVLDVARSLKDDKFEVSLLILGRVGEAAKHAQKLGLQILTLPAANREAAYQRMLEDEKVDLVNAHYSLYGSRLCAAAGVPFVQTVHNTYVWLAPEQIARYREEDPHTRAYICVSNSVAFYSDAQLGLTVDKMVVVPNGVEPTRFQLPVPGARQALRRAHGISDTDFVFVNVASVHETKAQRQIVNALAAVVKEQPGAKVLFLGRVMDEGYAAELKAFVAANNLTRSVIFAGHQDDVGAYFAMADAFLLPSFWEGWSLALAEALLVGLPAVASDVGSARELLAETGGELVPMPFGSIVELNAQTLRKHLETQRGPFVDALAAAMKRTCQSARPPAVSDAFRRRVDRRNAYRAYGHLFKWLITGGDPAAARRWLSAHSS